MNSLWLDAHLPPSLAQWVTANFGVECKHVDALGLRERADRVIAQLAGAAGAVVVTKDADFAAILRAGRGSLNGVIWLRCGNTTNAQLRLILTAALDGAIRRIDAGERVVEITGQD